MDLSLICQHSFRIAIMSTIVNHFPVITDTVAGLFRKNQARVWLIALLKFLGRAMACDQINLSKLDN